MGSYSPFEHYLTTLEVETCPEFWPPSPVSGPLCRALQGAGHREGQGEGPRALWAGRPGRAAPTPEHASLQSRSMVQNGGRMAPLLDCHANEESIDGAVTLHSRPFFF